MDKQIETYPKMNETIKKLLRMDKDNNMDAYILARIEELEKDCDYWKREALKWANELGEQRILGNVFKKGGVD